MLFRTRVGRGICLLVALSTIIATQSAVFGANQNLKAVDVSLRANGELVGQVLDQQGRPQALTQVALLQDQKAVGHVKTDIAGRFAIRGVKPGAYQIQSNAGVKSVRVWAHQTAPPVAHQAVLIVADGNITRAKGGFDSATYGPAARGAVAGALIGAGTFWAFDYNPAGS